MPDAALGDGFFAARKTPPQNNLLPLELRLRLRQPALQLFDPHFIRWMRAHEGHRVAAAVLLVVFGEALPELHRRLRVVTRARHEIGRAHV